VCCNGVVQFNTYTISGVRIAVELINNPAAELSFLTSLLSQYRVHQPVVTRAVAGELQLWAGQLRPVFAATDPHAQAALAGALLVASDCRPRLVSHDDMPHHLHYTPLDAALPARVKALTAAGLAHLIADGGGPRLGCCQRGGCGVVFFDTSRNGRRRFCSVRCANAFNVSSHRARKRQAAYLTTAGPGGSPDYSGLPSSLPTVGSATSAS
jgi:hypothetical protein